MACRKKAHRKKTCRKNALNLDKEHFLLFCLFLLDTPFSVRFFFARDFLACLFVVWQCNGQSCISTKLFIQFTKEFSIGIYSNVATKQDTVFNIVIKQDSLINISAKQESFNK